MLNTNIKHPYCRAFREYLRNTNQKYYISDSKIVIVSGYLQNLVIKFSDNYLTINNRATNCYYISIPFCPLVTLFDKLLKYNLINIITHSKLKAL